VRDTQNKDHHVRCEGGRPPQDDQNQMNQVAICSELWNLRDAGNLEGHSVPVQIDAYVRHVGSRLEVVLGGQRDMKQWMKV
jgi:hypothetical protein